MNPTWPTGGGLNFAVYKFVFNVMKEGFPTADSSSDIRVHIY